MSGPRDDPENLPDSHHRITFDSLLNPPGNNSDLWSQLPREMAALFRPSVDNLADEILHEVQASIPALARPADSVVGKSIIEGIQQAILQFNDRLADPSAPQADREALFRELGLHEIYDGPILDVLQMAYRVGARVAWRHMARVGERAGVPTATLCLLAEALFAYVDELSALSIEGHASAQVRAVGAIERRRKRLLDAILAPGQPPDGLDSLATSARWPLPKRVIAVAAEPRDGHVVGFAPVPDRRFLVDLEGAEPCLLLDHRDVVLLDGLPDLLPGWRMSIGPVVELRQAVESLRWARRTVALVREGVLPDVAVTWFDRHMTELWVRNDPFLMRQIAARALAPMASLTGRQRTKLAETLLVWLETRRSAPEIAALLDVHPQTVRYRMRQLERLFGSGLDDPDTRFAIEVALRLELTEHGPQ